MARQRSEVERRAAEEAQARAQAEIAAKAAAETLILVEQEAASIAQACLQADAAAAKQEHERIQAEQRLWLPPKPENWQTRMPLQSRCQVTGRRNGDGTGQVPRRHRG